METSLVRNGGRLRAVDVELAVDGVAVARASSLLLRCGEQPPGTPWRPPDWSFAHPLELARLDSPESRFLRMDVRTADGTGFFGAGRRRLWLREEAALVGGEDWTPFMRAAGVADVASPLANRGDEPLRFINADVTMYLGRLPVDEWLGLEVLDHLSDAGVAVGGCSIYDTAGRIGWCSVASLATAAPPAF